MRSDLELSRIEVEHLRNALETMRTEYEGRETAVRVRSCRFILEMVGYCKVPKATAIVILLRVLQLLGCQLCNFNSPFGGSFLFGGCAGRTRQGRGWRVVLLELYSCLAADGSRRGLPVQFKRCGFAMFIM